MNLLRSASKAGIVAIIHCNIDILGELVRLSLQLCLKSLLRQLQLRNFDPCFLQLILQSLIDSEALTERVLYLRGLVGVNGHGQRCLLGEATIHADLVPCDCLVLQRELC